jgi:HD-GYP domain-containing protein (c-di-GMP phosphodiesterase class II)
VLPRLKTSPAGPDLSRRVEKLQSILEVAKLVTAERDLDVLLPLILRHAAQVVEADRCSLFLLDRERNELWSKVAQKSALPIRLPLGSGIAGAVAESGAVINIPDAYEDARFNRSVDETTGYRTEGILCVPMRNAQGDITGVLQALNKRAGAFTEEDAELLVGLGGQAAVAIENAMLHESIGKLFEEFISASVVAIEKRDPTTAGHSQRVAALTIELARVTEQVSGGPYAGVRFTAEEIREIRYAALLHDFGKVAVPERVLVKADKLYPEQLELLRSRFELARKDLQLKSLEAQLAAAKRGDRAAWEALERDEQRRLTSALEALDQMFSFVLACNRPTILAEGGFERLGDLGKVCFQDSRGQRHPLLSQEEIELLSIPRGSLSAPERREIESHVQHTYEFLACIPWTRDLKRVPEIAAAHHEKLNGRGYPRGVDGPGIPLPSKMMTVCDIYDALTAADRPYKKAVPHPRALEILEQECINGTLDRELLRLFIEAEVPRRAVLVGPTRW